MENAPGAGTLPGMWWSKEQDGDSLPSLWACVKGDCRVAVGPVYGLVLRHFLLRAEFDRRRRVAHDEMKLPGSDSPNYELRLNAESAQGIGCRDELQREWRWRSPCRFDGPVGHRRDDLLDGRCLASDAGARTSRVGGRANGGSLGDRTRNNGVS